MAPITFNPQTDIPSLAGKVILVTGGTAGLGKETVLSFAAHGPAHIYFTGRSQGSADAVVDQAKFKHPRVPVSFIKCDLASLESVQQAAREFLSKSDRLDIFMANAGIMAVPHSLTKDGYEIQFGTNHMGHALLAKLLMPTLEATAKKTGDVRIVWNTSEGYAIHPKGGVIFDEVKTDQRCIAPIMGRWTRYGQSKVANMWYAREVAKHHPSITSVVIHPGVSATGLVTSLSLADRILVRVTNIGKMISPEECAYNQQWAATTPLSNLENGKFYLPVGQKKIPTNEGGNEELSARLWDWTQEELNGWNL